ncbi:MAG: prepilin-type N-terminal cleavage/methylation domain-containing protein [Betaproteobacteria bacterium]|nr:prepilin-type N-terminal cleavage/methylation domain-containing protein [Betaproteobacteria bacterium]
MKTQKGFTLIEIAIVLVIIGLLLGGVLKGQELITSARVRNLISQQDGIKAAFFGFQDRYRALPGDYRDANSNINCSTACAVGDGNGRIDGTSEPFYAWHHLNASGFLNGTYVAASGVTAPLDTNSPKNPYGTYLQLIYDNTYGDPTASPALPDKHNLKSGNQVPIEIIAEVDRKIDDGVPYQGSFQFSEYVQPGGTQPTIAHCVDTGKWRIAGSSANCGASSIF